MVYLLHAYFGRDGREEAEALLERNSGDEDNPRILELLMSLYLTGKKFLCLHILLIEMANTNLNP